MRRSVHSRRPRQSPTNLRDLAAPVAAVAVVNLVTTTTRDLLAAPEALAERLGVDATDPRVWDALRSASARFRAAVRHPVSRIERDTVTLDGTGAGSLLLPAAPVTALERVTVDGDDITEAVQCSADGMLRWPGGFPDTLGAVQVVYTHGYEPVPDEIADVVLSVAETAYAGAGDVASMTVGGEQITFRQGVSHTWSVVAEQYRLNCGDRS